MGGKIWIRNVAQEDLLPPTDSVLLSETFGKSAGKKTIMKHGN
jgi:hypothetical protein